MLYFIDPKVVLSELFFFYTVTEIIIIMYSLNALPHLWAFHGLTAMDSHRRIATLPSEYECDSSLYTIRLSIEVLSF